MGIIFKKGHIIPRWCHVKTIDRKAVVEHIHGDFPKVSGGAA